MQVDTLLDHGPCLGLSSLPHLGSWVKWNTDSCVVCANKNPHLRTTSDSLKEIISSESLRGASSVRDKLAKLP